MMFVIGKCPFVICRLTIMGLLVSSLLVGQVRAAIDAGSVLQQIDAERSEWRKPPERPDREAQDPERVPESGGVEVMVNEVVFEGNTNINTEVLQELFAPFLGKAYTFSGLKNLILMIGELYRSEGLWARGVLPDQTLEDGVLRILVVEGELGSLIIEKIDDDIRFSEERARDIILRGQTEGEVFKIGEFSKSMQNLDAVPGITAGAVLRAGKQEGETDLIVKMASTSLFSGNARIDNHGGRATSWDHGARFIGLLNSDSPFGFGEQFNFQTIQTDGVQLYSGGLTWLVDDSGSTATASYSKMYYEVGAPLESVGASGDSTVINFGYARSLYGGENFVMNGRLDFNNKEFFNEAGADLILSEKEVNSFSASLTSSWQDELFQQGFNAWALIYTAGDLDLGLTPSNLATDQAGPRTQGGYGKVMLSIGRQDLIGEKNTLGLNLLAQLSNNNLDSSEKISLGGPTAIRAYPGGEASGDHGATVQLQFQRQLSEKSNAAVFYDHGWIQLNHDAFDGFNSADPSQTNNYELNGYGVSYTWMSENALEFNVMLANRLRANPAPDAAGNDSDGTKKTPRLWLSLTQQF
ncbi:MAG: ShlB/FhaC/HecB family hemolysin secretion/activation protein [Betaproteobacteria bacterium]